MLSLVLAALVAADAGTPDAGVKDAGVVIAVVGATVARDGGSKDAGTPVKDAGVPDAGKPKDAGVTLTLAPMPTKLADGGTFATCKSVPQVCFSPEGNCDLMVVSALSQAVAPDGADIAIYSLNRESIVQALLKLREKNVPVRLIVDTSQISDPKEQPVLRRLLAAKIPMKRDTHDGIMHDKIIIVNKKLLFTGSFNFTNNASENNDENAMLWECPRMAAVYETKFEALWGKFKDASELVMRDGG